MEGLSFDELVGWQAFYDLEPWGCDVEDMRTEYLLRMMFSIHAKKGAPIPRFIDRNPEPKKRAKPNLDELEDNIRATFSRFKVVRNDRTTTTTPD